MKKCVVTDSLIYINLKWWESCGAERPVLPEEDREYLNSIVVATSRKRKTVVISNTERARKIFGVTQSAS